MALISETNTYESVDLLIPCFVQWSLLPIFTWLQDAITIWKFGRRNQCVQQGPSRTTLPDLSVFAQTSGGDFYIYNLYKYKFQRLYKCKIQLSLLYYSTVLISSPVLSAAGSLFCDPGPILFQVKWCTVSLNPLLLSAGSHAPPSRLEGASLQCPELTVRGREQLRISETLYIW